MSAGFHCIRIKPIIKIVHHEKVCLGGIEESAAERNEYQYSAGDACVSLLFAYMRKARGVNDHFKVFPSGDQHLWNN